MSNPPDTPADKQARTLDEAVVVHVVDDSRVAINHGSRNGVKLGQRYLLYELGEEIKDPVTGENLGRLEIVKGTGTATHVQERMATISSDRKASGRRIIKRPFFTFGPETEERIDTYNEAFDSPKLGDHARPV
ncbi:MAG: hypothetical protein ACHQZS_07835 [Candidatus Binatales bacterium]